MATEGAENTEKPSVPSLPSVYSVADSLRASISDPQSSEVVLTFFLIAEKICALTNPKFHKLRVFFG